MKKVLFLLSLVLLTLPAMSQGRKYKKAMKAGIEQLTVAADPAAELELVPLFEDLAKNHPDQWLPSYYACRILITSSFEESGAEKSDALLDRSKTLLNNIMELVPEESEAHVLESLYYIGMMSVDPMTRGQLYFQDALDAIEKSLRLNPENPRAHFMNGMMTLNMPDFMGGGPGPAKPIFLEAAEKFKTFQSEDPFWPVWGEDLVEAELEGMK